MWRLLLSLVLIVCLSCSTVEVVVIDKSPHGTVTAEETDVINADPSVIRVRGDTAWSEEEEEKRVKPKKGGKNGPNRKAR